MTLQEVKRRFFAMRNGLLADMLRKQCRLPHKLIFGLNLPQIKEIAREAGEDPALGAELWADAGCRESRLMAPMVMPRNAEAYALAREAATEEEADVLCHSLLRHCPDPVAAAVDLAADPRPMTRYCALRLLLNLQPEAAPEAAAVLESIEFNPVTDGVARQLRQRLQEDADDL